MTERVEVHVATVRETEDGKVLIEYHHQAFGSLGGISHISTVERMVATLGSASAAPLREVRVPSAPAVLLYRGRRYVPES